MYDGMDDTEALAEADPEAEAPGSGLDEEAPGAGRSAAPRRRAPQAAGNGWVPLPPDPHAKPGAEQPRRYRAPWATGPSSTGVPAPPAPSMADTGAPPTPVTAVLSKRSVPRPAPPHPGPPSGHGSEPPPGATRPEAHPAPAPHAERPFTFTGTAGEYFRIWIVNVCLTALTLGLYSAWAKVRTQRYLYRHTRLDGSPFDYLAEPMQILKGRMVLAGGFGLYMAAGYTLPWGQAALSLALVFLVPWAVVRALRFRAGVSAWRNIRFGFDAGYGEALKVFIGLPIAVALTLGLAYPYYQWRRHRFQVENSRFGTEPFTFSTASGQFYRLHLFIGLLTLLMAVPAVALTVVLMPSLMPGPELTGPGLVAPGAVPVGALAQAGTTFLAMNVLFGLGALWVWSYARAHTANLVWNGTQAGPHQFSSRVTTRDLFMLYLTNAVAVTLSLGLMVPWARLRAVRYRVEHLAVEGPGLEAFAAAEASPVGAAGDEIADALDLGLGL